jgi:tetratricopeptide (TPR) repeat protein
MKRGRNDPCPCGSGKKYKRCCLPRNEAAASKPTAPEPSAPLAWVEDDDLDELSNRVPRLIEEGKLDEAEAICRELRNRYPEVHDWMERMGQVQQARGNYRKAAQLYREAAAFVEQRDGYDPEVGEWLRKEAAAWEKRAERG